jgi:predicted pyridoxine 5'-phosphate oxidase superfamily flavin-nucleotide-binding protein
LQCALGTEDRAERFYTDQVRDRLLPTMIEFVGRMEMLFLATSDADGGCDSSLRAGPPGFVQVLDEHHLAYPEYRGNGVHASLGNISENPHVGMFMVDFERDLIGLHVNGRVQIVEDDVLRVLHPHLPTDPARGRRAERWVVIRVVEAYIHCRKHIPRMVRAAQKRDWGTDDPARKGGDYFGAKAERAERLDAARQSDPGGLDGSGELNGSDELTSGQRSGSGESETHTVPMRIPPPRAAWTSPRPRFPSTTHLPVGAATARPLRAARPGPPVEPRTGRRIRWLSS